MEKALAVLCSAHSLASNDRGLKAKVRSVWNAQRTYPLLLSYHMPLHPHPHPLFCPLQCTYSTGHCLHLLSKCAGPDPELQWKEGECEGWMGEEGRRLGGEGAPHSTLSTIMRREEASQAEVSVAHPTMKVWCICVTTKEMCITTATVQSYSVQTDSVTAIVHLQSAFPKVFQTQNIAKYSALKN